MVTNTWPDNIKIGIDPSFFNTWYFPARDAMQHWAQVTNCRANFYLVTDLNTSDTRVIPDNGMLSSNTIAAAEIPQNGNPGTIIYINTDFYSTWPGSSVPVNSQGSNRLYNMVHEIGHTLGLEHTNQSGAVQVPGTPSSDAGSVMNGGTALNTWNGLSANDQVAVRFLFPEAAINNWITNPNEDFNANSAGTARSYEGFTISWNPAVVSTSTISLHVYQNRTFIATIASGIPNSGSYYWGDIYNYIAPKVHPQFDAMIQIQITSDNPTGFSDFSTMFHILYD
ncbi:MAG: matrixin family metalloprotease [Chitinophagaceae bacterium]